MSVRSHEVQTHAVRPRDVSQREADLGGTHISPRRMANFWGVHVNTVYRDIDKGAIRAFRLPGGQLRIRSADARRYGRPID